jgi:hypothetical protein
VDDSVFCSLAVSSESIHEATAQSKGPISRHGGKQVVQRKCVAIFVLHIDYQYASSFSNLQFCAVTMPIQVATVAVRFLQIQAEQFSVNSPILKHPV